MAEREFFGTARELRDATAASLGFGATPTDISLGSATTIRFYPVADQQGADSWRPDASALAAARERLSSFSARIMHDEGIASMHED